MKPKQMAKLPAPAAKPDIPKKLASKANASRNTAQADAVLRSKKHGQRQAISARIDAARGAASPAAMIAALHDVRPLGHQLATTGAGKSALDKTIDSAVRAWEAVLTQSGGGNGTANAMPKTTKGNSHAGFPDVCRAPAPPAPFVPVPFPNVSQTEQASAEAGDAARGAADAAPGAADDAADAAHNAADAVHDAAEEGAGAAQDAAGDAADHAQDAGNDAANTVSSWLHH